MTNTIDYSEIKPETKSGNEPFHINSQNLDFKLIDFWKWNQSNLIENRTRGILAEYIVRAALEIKSNIRVEWDNYDLVSNTGKKIEVKSAAYIQSWAQKKRSSIRFSIGKSIGVTDYAGYDGKSRRWADFYVFCLLAHEDQKTINPLNLEQWKFYILETSILNQHAANQKTIGLKSLLKMKPKVCTFQMIKAIIDGSVSTNLNDSVIT